MFEDSMTRWLGHAKFYIRQADFLVLKSVIYLYLVYKLLEALEQPFFQRRPREYGAEYRGTARIGLIALFPTQGPRAEYLHS